MELKILGSTPIFNGYFLGSCLTPLQNLNGNGFSSYSVILLTNKGNQLSSLTWIDAEPAMLMFSFALLTKFLNRGSSYSNRLPNTMEEIILDVA